MYDGQPLHLATNLYTESGLSSVPKYIFTRYPRLRPRGINPNPPYKVKLVKTSSPREGFHLMTRRTQDSNLQWLSPSPAFKAGSLPIRIIRHLNNKKRVATNPHLPAAAHAPVYWWPPHWFCSSSLHILYFSDSSYGAGGGT